MGYYIAYGSNLSFQQMAERCPGAKPLGYTIIEGYRLLFRHSKSGNYLTIEKMEGRSVPAVIWEVSEENERSLDDREGYPTWYHKETMTVKLFSLEAHTFIKEIEAFVYIMNIINPLGKPRDDYYLRCEGGYKHFGFDTEILKRALEESVE